MRVSAEASQRNGAAGADARPAAAGKPAGDPRAAAALVDAGVRVFTALRRVVTAELALLAAEARVLRASAAVVFLAGVALVAFAVSLWACIVALIGWAIAVAAHSVGIALGALIVLHLILIFGIWIVMRRAIHHATFPRARSELAALGRTLRRDLDRFQHAPPPPREPAP